MSVAIDTDAPAQEKTEFDADFETGEYQMEDAEPDCLMTFTTVL
jgi:hypothetical protein